GRPGEAVGLLTGSPTDGPAGEAVGLLTGSPTDGPPGEAVGLLLTGSPTDGPPGEAVGLLPGGEAAEGPTVLEVDVWLRGLARERKAAGKQAAVAGMLGRSSPVERKYLVKTLSGGLRIGAD